LVFFGFCFFHSIAAFAASAPAPLLMRTGTALELQELKHSSFDFLLLGAMDPQQPESVVAVAG
jgi:hypothetical protein